MVTRVPCGTAYRRRSYFCLIRDEFLKQIEQSGRGPFFEFLIIKFSPTFVDKGDENESLKN